MTKGGEIFRNKERRSKLPLLKEKNPRAVADSEKGRGDQRCRLH